MEYVRYRITGTGSVRIKGRFWQAIFSVEEPDGARRQRTIMTPVEIRPDLPDQGKAAAMVTLGACRAKLDAKLNGSTNLLAVTGHGITDAVREFIETKYRNARITTQTRDYYMNLLPYIERGLGDVDFRTLTPVDVQNWINTSLQRGDSLQMIKRAYKLLRSFYMYYRNISVAADPPNPCRGVIAPRTEKPLQNPLDRQGIISLNTALRGMPDDNLTRSVTIALHTGMRIGEVCGLRWRDVDFDLKILRVRRSVSVTQSKGILLKSPKNRKTREVPLDSFLAHYLRTIFNRETRWRPGVEDGFNDWVLDSFVVDHLGLSPRSTKAISRRFARFVTKINLLGIDGKPVTFHGLRHTFATQWIAAGGDVRALADVLGHADVSVTLNTYASADRLSKLYGISMTSTALTAGALEDVDPKALKGERVPVMLEGMDYAKLEDLSWSIGVETGELASRLVRIAMRLPDVGAALERDAELRRAPGSRGRSDRMRPSGLELIGPGGSPWASPTPNGSPLSFD